MSDFMPATVLGYSEWPKNTPNYWALPAMGDAVGWTYRKDWFYRPEIKPSSRRSTGATWRRPRPRTSSSRSPNSSRAGNRRQEGLWRLHLHRARLGRHHDGRDQRALPVRLQVRRSEEAVRHARLRQLTGRRQGSGVLQGALQVLHAARADQRLHAGRSRCLQVGPGRDADELVRLLPGLYKDPNVGGDKIGFFVNPVREDQASSSAGKAFRWSPTRRIATRRCNTSSGSRSPTCSRNGGRSAATRAARRCFRTPAS